MREIVTIPLLGLPSMPLTRPRRHNHNGHMPQLDIQKPGMPDLQFVLFVSALCTSNLENINVPKALRTGIFDRCWALVNVGPPPLDPKERVLDLRHGTDLTLEACLSTIRSLLMEAGITQLVWDHPVSDPTHGSSPAAQPLIDRLGQLYPDHPEIVDPLPPDGRSSGRPPRGRDE